MLVSKLSKNLVVEFKVRCLDLDAVWSHKSKIDVVRETCSWFEERCLAAAC